MLTVAVGRDKDEKRTGNIWENQEKRKTSFISIDTLASKALIS